jgi:SAM-dependent methyltransferase
LKCDRNYEKLSYFYDLLMQGVDYEGWVDYVEEILKHFQGKACSVVDLACGTGNSTLPWSKRGYLTFGVDLSDEMLAIARQKAAVQGSVITYLQQDLCSMELPEEVDLAVCFQDGLNYILNLQELGQAFQAVFNNLKSGGFFIFDLNYLPRIISQNEEFLLAQDDWYSFVWRSRYLKAENLWEIFITGKVKDNKGQIEHFSEIHRERIYEEDEVWSLLTSRGFTVLGNYQAFSFSLPHKHTPRVVYIAQKI